MYILFLLLLFPYDLNCLRCIDSGRHEGHFNDYGTTQFEEALNNLAYRTIDNTHIGRCHVTIELISIHHKFVIEYRGNNITSQLSDTLNIRTEFVLTKILLNASGIQNTLTYVCSSSDFCDLKYIDNWLPWLFRIDFSQLGNQLNSEIATKNYSKDEPMTCYTMGKEKPCSSHVCQAVQNENETTTQCTEQDQIPEALKSIESIDKSTVSESFDPNKLPELFELIDLSKFLEVLAFIDTSALAQLGGITDPSDLEEILKSFDADTLSELLRSFDPSKISEIMGSSDLSKFTEMLGPIQSFLLANMAYTVVIVDTTVTKMISSDGNNGIRPDLHKYQLNRTVSSQASKGRVKRLVFFLVLTARHV
jgi:hypothetical protein